MSTDDFPKEVDEIRNEIYPVLKEASQNGFLQCQKADYAIGALGVVHESQTGQDDLPQ